MRLVDSSAWVEYLSGGETGRKVKAQLPDSSDWLVPTIVQLELAKWAYRVLPVADAEQAIAFSRTCVVTTLDTRLALLAAALCRKHKLATADAIIYATAEHHGADLLTCDAHFKALDNVIYIPKAKS